MSIETKKNNLISLILSVADESIIDQINAKIIKLIPKNNVRNYTGNTLSKYKTEIVEKLDLELIKKQQNYQSPDISEIEKIIKDADIQEPIDELLKMI